jgi:hypothetical protein
MRGAARAAADAAGGRTEAFTTRAQPRGGGTDNAGGEHPECDAGNGPPPAVYRDGGPPHAAVTTFLRPTNADLSWLEGPVILFPAKKVHGGGVATGAGAAAEEVLKSALVAVAESEVREAHTPPPSISPSPYPCLARRCRWLGARCAVYNAVVRGPYPRTIHRQWE